MIIGGDNDVGGSDDSDASDFKSIAYHTIIASVTTISCQSATSIMLMSLPGKVLVALSRARVKHIGVDIDRIPCQQLERRLSEVALTRMVEKRQAG